MAARQTLSAVLGLKGEHAEVLRFLGEAGYLWLYLGELDEAMKVFEGIMVLAPNDPVGFLGCSEVYLAQGKYKEAERAATDATRTANIGRTPLAFAHVLRGRALMGLSRAADANKAWQKACEIDPNGAGKECAKARMEVAKVCGPGAT